MGTGQLRSGWATEQDPVWEGGRKTWEGSSVVEYSPSVYKALRLALSTAKIN